MAAQQDRTPLVQAQQEEDPDGLLHFDGTGLYERPDWPLMPSGSSSTQQHTASARQLAESATGSPVNGDTALRSADEIRASPLIEATDMGDLEEHDDGQVVARQSTHEYHEEEEEEQLMAHGQAQDTAEDKLPQATSGGVALEDSDKSSSKLLERDVMSSARVPMEAANETSDEIVGSGLSPHRSKIHQHRRQSEQYGAVAEEDEGSELRDVAMPLASDPQAQSTQFQPRSPQQSDRNIVPTTPPQETRSKTLIPPEAFLTAHGGGQSRFAQSPPNTLQNPSNKSRLRYSWQSLPEDEPNRPRIHIIKLFSNTVSASSAFPQGEAFGFAISPSGRRIALFNSARLYVVQTAALPVGITQDYTLKRRPLAVEFSDEKFGLMAILADEHTVNVYDMGHQRLQRIRTITLDFPSNCIALASTGGLLAAAYEGGVEIFSLSPSALPTDRRAVRSVRMDKLAFSDDCSTLIGTTIRINASSSVVVSVPVFPSSSNASPTDDELKEAWCSELLHPENIRNSSHATFMRENASSCTDRLFAWNGLADTFGILDTTSMKYGNIDFPVVISPPLSTCGGLGAAIHSCPAVNELGDTVAMIVNDRTVRLYIVPPQNSDAETSIEAHSIDHELDEGYGCPFNEVRWVNGNIPAPVASNSKTFVRGRLIVTSPGGVSDTGFVEDSVEGIEGGRIILFDFDPQFAGQPGQTFNLTLGKSPPQPLEEEQIDEAERVALLRRRTVNQKKNAALNQRPPSLGRAASTFGNARSNGAESPSWQITNGVPQGRNSMLLLGVLQPDASRSLPNLLDAVGTDVVLEEPYAQNAPRSYASLQRAASNAQRHRYQTLEERQQERASTARQDQLLPLPEYSEEPNAPLPNRFRAMAGLDSSPRSTPAKPSLITGFSFASSANNPVTAPPNIGESFSAERAFIAASSQMRSPSRFPAQAEESGRTADRTPRMTHGTPPQPLIFHSSERAPESPVIPVSSPLQRDGMPSPLNDVVSPLGSGSDTWNVSPTVGRRLHLQAPRDALHSGSASWLSPTAASSASDENAWDVVSPISPRHLPPHFEQGVTAGEGGQEHNSPNGPPGQSTSRLRDSPSSAAAARSAASLFPPAHPANRVPYRQSPMAPSAAAHPVTAWRPPGAASSSPHSSAASTPLASPRGLNGANTSSNASSPSASSHQTRRTSSVSGRGAFASTSKAKRLGFYKQKSPHLDSSRASSARGPSRSGVSDEAVNGFRSTTSLSTKSNTKCSLM